MEGKEQLYYPEWIDTIKEDAFKWYQSEYFDKCRDFYANVKLKNNFVTK